MNRLIHSKAAIRPFLMVSLLACAISLAQEVPKPPKLSKPTPTLLPVFEPPLSGTGFATEPILPSNLKDFDVWASPDPNGFPLNPKWGQQVRDHTIPSPTKSCPVGDADSVDWTSSPTCTSYPVTFNESFWCKRHVNFMPVTYEGFVYWEGTGELGDFFPFGDSDYNFNVDRADQALYSTAGYHAHIEFDSRETVDQWDKTDTWWMKFHHERGIDKTDSERRGLIDGHFAIVIGMLGMDTYTGPGHSPSGQAKTELHPVYTMFVRVDQNLRLRQNKWAFFVRNWENEGYCGANDVPLPTQVVKVQIPRPAAEVVPTPNVRGGARKANNTEVKSSMNWKAEPNPTGMLLTFSLLSPEKESWIVGDIIVQEPLLPARALEPEHPQFKALRAEIDKLPENSRKELLAQLQGVVLRKEEGVRLSGKIIAEPAPVGEKLAFKSPTKVEPKGDLVQLKKDSVGELTRRKQLEVLRKFFAERGVQVDLPPEK